MRQRKTGKIIDVRQTCATIIVAVSECTKCADVDCTKKHYCNEDGVTQHNMEACNGTSGCIGIGTEDCVDCKKGSQLGLTNTIPCKVCATCPEECP